MNDHTGSDLEQVVDIATTVPLPAALPRIEAECDAITGLDAWVWDYQRRVLQSVRTAETADAETVLAGGRTFEAERRLAVPLTALGEEIGMLTCCRAPGAMPVEAEACIDRLADVIALLVRSNELVVDTIAVRRRRRDMSLPAELQWSMLPPSALDLPDARLTAIIEPAYDCGGDVYDFALNGDRLFLVVLDAVGHGLRAAQLSMVALGALRRARRNGADLDGIVDDMHRAISSVGSGTDFVTAVMVDIDLQSWSATWLSAGHLPPMTFTGGSPFELPLRPTLPLGLSIGAETPSPTVQEIDLAPGDALVLYSDGVIDNLGLIDEQWARSERFTEALEAALGSDGRDIARNVIEELLQQSEPVLRDDATLMVLQRKPLP